MRILQVTPILDPTDLWTGPHRVVFNISKALAARGHEVTVLTSDMLTKNQRITETPMDSSYNFKIRRVANVSSSLSNLSGLVITPSMNQYLSKRTDWYDVIHVHEYRTYQNVVVNKYAHIWDVPYFVHPHGSLPRIGEMKFLKLIFDYIIGLRILREASCAIASNNTELRHYNSFKVRMENVTIIPNGVDLSEFSKIPSEHIFREQYAIDDHNKIILFLGRIHWIKGVDILLRSFAIIRRQFENIVLIIAGSGPFLTQMKNLTHSLGLEEDVLFLGPVTERIKLEVLASADIFVLPSRYEMFPVVIPEAYACSKPIVASNVNSIAEIVQNHKSGLLFESESVIDLSEKILYLLQHPNIATEMGHEGLKLVKKSLSMTKIAELLEESYMNVLNY
jgi:glycosyltransferase involved in cell wall biosynthesis